MAAAKTIAKMQTESNLRINSPGKRTLKYLLTDAKKPCGAFFYSCSLKQKAS
jgi:hypothetical protein